MTGGKGGGRRGGGGEESNDTKSNTVIQCPKYIECSVVNKQIELKF